MTENPLIRIRMSLCVAYTGFGILSPKIAFYLNYEARISERERAREVRMSKLSTQPLQSRNEFLNVNAIYIDKEMTYSER
jgi:hypothetical protein